MAKSEIFYPSCAIPQSIWLVIIKTKCGSLNWPLVWFLKRRVIFQWTYFYISSPHFRNFTLLVSLLLTKGSLIFYHNNYSLLLHFWKVTWKNEKANSFFWILGRYFIVPVSWTRTGSTVGTIKGRVGLGRTSSRRLSELIKACFN